MSHFVWRKIHQHRDELKLKLLGNEINQLKSKLELSGETLNPKVKESLLSSLKAMQKNKEDSEYIIEELLTLNQEIMNSNKETAELQPKYIDVGMLMYNKLKSNYQKSNKKIREYTERLQQLMDEKNARIKSKGP